MLGVFYFLFLISVSSPRANKQLAMQILRALGVGRALGGLRRALCGRCCVWGVLRGTWGAISGLPLEHSPL